jgi:hypothetical protein
MFPMPLADDPRFRATSGSGRAGYTGNNAWDSTSQVKPGEVRFQGVYSAYITDSTRWYGIKADGSTTECYWGNNKPWISYEGQVKPNRFKIGNNLEWEV